MRRMSRTAGARSRAAALAVLGAALLLAPRALGYDGPVGVTFAAPWIGKEPGSEAALLERIEILSELRTDPAWSRDPANARRAFPTGFTATEARTRMRLRLRNGAPSPLRATILFPFHASATEGTGFTRPSESSATIDGSPAGSAPAIVELGRSDQFAFRGVLLRVDLAALATRDIEVSATHALAVSPAWYHFEFRTGFAPDRMSAGFRPLLNDATSVRFRLASPDPALTAARLRYRICRIGDPACDERAGTLADINARFAQARIPSSRLAAILVDRSD